ncbi:hypothetical protein MesoLj131c_65930 (plasmid) [Mesorhizobium sp. 131-3-5]|nr:hypothetical protein MesoLj131c_65930 [Mesorhizobium sp. 131-3-5]
MRRRPPDCKGEHVQALLAPASGFLHADAYVGYVAACLAASSGAREPFVAKSGHIPHR